MNKFFFLFRVIVAATLMSCFMVLIFALYYMEFELPDIESLNTVQLQVPLQIFSHDGKLLATFGEKRRIPIPYDKIPQPLIQAVLATEDQRYYQHRGVDVHGLGRAALQVLATGRKVQGGSTITMQVARSFYLSRHKTFARKIREILLAIKIEHKLSKEKILELYLNKVFLGNRAYGVGAAAEIYYGKHLNELTLDQYAMLAGLPKAPSTLNPLANPEAAKKRRDHVLSRMLEQGYITQEAYDAALKADLNASYHDLKTELRAPYVAELAREQLEQMYGDSIYTDGFRVYTTIDSHLQLNANQSVRDSLLAYDQRHGYRGPIDNLGTPALDKMDEWQLRLKKTPTINGLEPAAVVELTPETATVLRLNGEFTIIPWDGLSWARTQINADYLGPKPKQTSQILNLGDLIYISHTGNNYRLAQLPKAEAGLVAINPQNGAVLAMIGGFDYQKSKFNRIVNAKRQPGSSFKPFIYAAALDKGLTLSTVVNDAPIIIENTADNSLWRPQNVNHKFYGPTRLRTAIIQSRNLVSIRVLAQIGVNYTVNYLKRFGFSRTQMPPGLSLALGTPMVTPMQMAQAFAVFANGGMKVVPYVIGEIRNSHNDVIYQARPLVVCHGTCEDTESAAPRVISPETAFLISSTLQDVIQHGTAARAKALGRADIAGKTGTTQNQVDAWFAGYHQSIVAITWMGFDHPQSLHEFGAVAALPMWMEFMRAALKDVPEVPLAPPEGILRMPVNRLSGLQTTARDPDRVDEYFMEPYFPNGEANEATTAVDPNTDEGQTAVVNTPAYMRNEKNAADEESPTLNQSDDNSAINNNVKPEETTDDPMAESDNAGPDETSEGTQN